MIRVNLNSFFQDVARIYGDSKTFDSGRIHHNLASEELTQEDFKVLGENIFIDLFYDDNGECVKVATQKGIYHRADGYPRQTRVGACFQNHIKPRASVERLSLEKLINLVRNEIYGSKNSNQYECYKEAKDPESSNANTNCDNFEDTYLVSKNIIEEFASKKQREEFTKGYKNFIINFAKEVKSKALEKFSKLSN